MWYRGSIHIHTSVQDGSLSPLEIIRWYKVNGYDFVALTDHDIITETGIEEEKDFLVIKNSFEFGQWESFLHILGLGIDRRKDIPKGILSHQEKIDFINKNNGISIICHPNWNWVECRYSDLIKLRKYYGIEIYNTLMKHETGSPYAVDKWDYLLSSGRKTWGFAVDDLHDSEADLIGKGWIMVESQRLVREDILTCIREGKFYASTGARLKKYSILNGIIDIESENGEEVVFIGENGKILKTDNSGSSVLDIRDFSSKYIRIEIRSREGIAFTQPIFLKDI
jgi:hypothetical protein